MQVEIYKNLHKDCWSIRHKGKVIRYCHKATLKNCRFVVQPAGRAKVLREQRKNVHAFVRGELVDRAIIKNSKEVSYNPYYQDHFYVKEDKSPIYQADKVRFTKDTVIAGS